MLTSHCKETKQPPKKFKVDWFWGYIPIYPPSLRLRPRRLPAGEGYFFSIFLPSPWPGDGTHYPDDTFY